MEVEKFSSVNYDLIVATDICLVVEQLQKRRQFCGVWQIFLLEVSRALLIRMVCQQIFGVTQIIQ